MGVRAPGPSRQVRGVDGQLRQAPLQHAVVEPDRPPPAVGQQPYRVVGQDAVLAAAGGILIDVRGSGPDRTAVREQATARGLRFAEFGFTPSGADLESITNLVERGSLRVAVDHVLPLEEAAKAHELSETNRVTGKIVLTP
ncbi:zinc-binding dehydrogenase [Streptomyces sp. NPDC039016]|uniref:zinc-binding dehydrogenase n=1 Tax=Streptomyces sp. NPDC039016 TaxID=3154330 RepID=UPI001C608C37